MADVKRTSMNLDRELVREAQAALGTDTVTETIHAALRSAIEQRRREKEIDDAFWEAISNLDLEAMRDQDPWEDVDW